VLASLADGRAVAASFCGELGVTARATELNLVELERRLAVEERYLPSGMSLRPPPSADARAASAGTAGLPWCPVVDGEVLVTSVPAALADAAVSVDALLIGTTTEEFNFTLWPAEQPPSREACERGFAQLGVGPDGMARYAAAARSGTLAEGLAQAQTDWRFRAPARRLADASAATGLATYAYQFGWRSPARGGALGAAHCLDLPFFFDNLGAPGAAELLGPAPPASLAAAMHGALVSFAAAGDPGWPAYHAPDRTGMVFDRAAHTAPDPFSTAALGLVRIPD
jgi:para-nitrobenzyl esterase